MPQEYTEQGLPAAPTYGEKGFQNGSVSQAANTRHAILTAPSEGPGAFRRFAQGYGLPTSMDEFQQALGGLPPVQFYQHPSVYNAARAISPLPIMGEAIGNVLTAPIDMSEGNVAGGLGKIAQVATPWALSKVAALPMVENATNYMGGALKAAAKPSNWPGVGSFAKAIHKGGIAGVESAHPVPVPVKTTTGPKAPAGSIFSTPSEGLGQQSLAATDPAQLPAIPGAAPAPRPITPAAAPSPLPEMWGGPTPPTAEAAIGEAPYQRNNQPMKSAQSFGARKSAAARMTNKPEELAARTEIPTAEAEPSGARGATESYLPSHQAVKGQVLAATKTGMTWVEKVEGGNATIATKNHNSGLVTTKVVPIRKSMLDPTAPGYKGPNGEGATVPPGDGGAGLLRSLLFGGEEAEQ